MGSETNNSTFSNNATPSILGFEYQKLIALEYCLNSKSGDIVYIECYGDVATKDATIETKHHEKELNLADQSPEFWKTLKNFVLEKEITDQFSKLILHTTASINQKSIFWDWNSKNSNEKYCSIEKYKYSSIDSINRYVALIFNFNDSYQKADLLNILNRFEIRSSQPDIRKKCDELKDHPVLSLVDEKYRDELLQYLHGYITKRAIKNHDKWHIVYDEFIRDIRSYTKKYMNDKIPFPEDSLEIKIAGNNNYVFIEELKKIDLESKVEEAVIDYLKTAESTIQLIRWGGQTTTVAIDNFESELHMKMKNLKEINALDLSISDLSKPQTIKKSKGLFFGCKNFEKLSIRGVQDIELYYQHGKMHKIVEDHKFVWRFLEEDVS